MELNFPLRWVKNESNLKLKTNRFNNWRKNVSRCNDVVQRYCWFYKYMLESNTIYGHQYVGGALQGFRWVLWIFWCIQSWNHWRCVLCCQWITSSRIVWCAQSCLDGIANVGSMQQTYYTRWTTNSRKNTLFIPILNLTDCFCKF